MPQSSTKQRHCSSATVKTGCEARTSSPCDRGDLTSRQNTLATSSHVAADSSKSYTSQRKLDARAAPTHCMSLGSGPRNLQTRLGSNVQHLQQAENVLKSTAPTDPRCVLGWESHPSEEPPPHGGRGKQPEHVVDGLRAMPVGTRGKTTPANPMLASDQPLLQPFGTILAGLGPKVSDIRFQVDLQPK